MSYVLALLGFCALIILHEGGHFAAAKAVGMRVEKFSLFFGPMVWSRRRGETEYGLGVIPLGGYVKITGMNPEEVPDDPQIAARAYVNQPVWKRIVVIGAGPVVNLVLAFLILWAVFMTSGTWNMNKGPLQVQAVEQGTAAWGKLQPGDTIVSVGGATTQKRIPAVVDRSRCPGAQTNGCVADPAVTMTVRRHGKLVTEKLHPRYSAALKRQEIGFEYGHAGVHYQLDAGGAAGHSLSTMGNEVSLVVTKLSQIYKSADRKQFHSVVGGYAMVQQATQASAAEGFGILAIVSLALGFMNLFPFLPLDGGHIFWALYEKVRGRKVSLATMERASYVGLVLVLGMFVIGFSNDISTLAHGGNFLR
ncbi:MAG: site-2 protease family protein [Solirubrobacterales bacterium]|nr:site-2 protease family protein [Solirubrobacterales bacterium]